MPVLWCSRPHHRDPEETNTIGRAVEDKLAREAIAEMARLIGGLVIAIRTPAMFDAAHYDRVLRDLKTICDRIEK